ncbi:MAG: UbiA family prenyltransferase [Planctomycetota bacterium]
MLGRVSQQVLTLLQLTRMALVFTAISNGLAALALRQAGAGQSVWSIDPWMIAGVMLVAVGLYGFGMVLNDVIDRRRDRHLARTRPLPSGRIGVSAAIFVAGVMLAVAVGGGTLLLGRTDPADGAGIASVVLVFVTAGFIAAYDLFGKYLVWVGLLLLGLVRFFHTTIADPTLTVVWHPLWLLNHVAIVSAVAYRWEAKRPALSRRQTTLLLAGLAVLNLGLVTALFLRRGTGFAESLTLSPALILPIVTAFAFAVAGHVIKRRSHDRRAAGKALILYGLLWLILYDALFVAGYVDLLAGALLLLLWPVSYLAVRTMRLWSSMTELAHKPQYIRAP